MTLWKHHLLLCHRTYGIEPHLRPKRISERSSLESLRSKRLCRS